MPNAPVPRTWVDTTDFFTAAAANTEIRDPLNFLLNRPRAVLARTSALALPTGVVTSVPWNSEIIDSHGGWAVGAPTRYVIQVPGKYSVSLVVPFSGTAGGGIRALFANVSDSATQYALAIAKPIDSTLSDTIVTSSIILPYTFAINEYIVIKANQTSGGSINVAGTSGNDAYVTIQWEAN